MNETLAIIIILLAALAGGLMILQLSEARGDWPDDWEEWPWQQNEKESEKND